MKHNSVIRMALTVHPLMQYVSRVMIVRPIDECSLACVNKASAVDFSCNNMQA